MKNGKLEETETHELALVYAHAKFAEYLANPHKPEREMSALIQFYKDAIDVLPSAEITEFT